MCLVTDSPPVKMVSKDEVTYYKVVKQPFFWDNDMETFMSPFLLFMGELGTRYDISKDEKWEISKEHYTDTEKTFYRVEGGGFHLFVDLVDARREANRLNDQYNTENYKVVRAIVPAGTEYIKGRYLIDPCVAVKSVTYEKL